MAILRKYFFVAAVCFLFLGAGEVLAATNISATTTEHWAWNDVIGWMDFFNTDSVTVATNRSGNICSTSSYGVRNDGVGNYSGWAWNDNHGWISFWCGNNSGCGSSTYRVTIDGNGRFRGFAWNDVAGWISVDCTDNPGGCDPEAGGSDYQIITSWRPTSTTGWLESPTFDTEIAAGVQLNSVLWQGDLPIGTTVKFQFAASNSSSGPWSFSGTDDTSLTYYDPTLSNTSIKLNYALYNNKRYFRYKAFFEAAGATLPRVDDVIINWSP